MSWDLEPWQANDGPEVANDGIIDAYWQPVQDDSPVVTDAADVIDVQVSWLTPSDDYPVKQDRSTSYELDTTSSRSDLEMYEPTQEDMATANEWLSRIETMTQPQSHLATRAEVQPQTLTAFWQHVSNPVRTISRRETYSSPSHSSRSSGGNRKPGWYFIAEPDPSEPESLRHLRYWYFQNEFAEGVTEWDEAAFLAWVASLSVDELATFADAGEQIALGNWQDHVSDATSDVIAQTRETQERDAGAIDYFFNSLRGVF